MAKTNTLSKALILAILSIPAALLVIGFASIVIQAQHASFITLSASGTAYATPNQVVLYLFINGTGSTAALATENMSQTVQKLNTTIFPFVNRNLSLIQTTYYSVSKPYQVKCYPGQGYPCSTSNFTGYVAVENIQVTLPNANNASAVITALSKIPNLLVQSVQPVLSNQATLSLNQRALSAALVNATSQARILAGNATQLAIENITVGNQYLYRYPYAVGASTSTNSNVTFFAGQISVSKTVTVVFSKR